MGSEHAQGTTLQGMICALALVTALGTKMQSHHVLLTFNNASICSLRKAESSDMACSFRSTWSIGRPRMRALLMARVTIHQQAQHASVEMLSNDQQRREMYNEHEQRQSPLRVISNRQTALAADICALLTLVTAATTISDGYCTAC